MSSEVVIDEVGKFGGVEGDAVRVEDWLYQVADRFGVALSSDRVEIADRRIRLG